MIDVRRAYRRWFWRRMSWLCPGLAAALVVFVRLAVDESLELWLRLPALAISGGVTLLFVGLTILPVFVLSAGRKRESRRAQMLRREFRSYPTLALISLSLAFILLAVPLLFGPAAPIAVPAPRTAAGPRVHRIPAPAPELDPVEPAPVAAIPEVPAAPAPAAPAPPAETPVAAAPVQEPLRLPEKTPPPAPVPAPATELPSGQELFTLRFRPDGDDWSPLTKAGPRIQALDRGGLPDERNPEDQPLPRLTLDITIVPQSGGWYGAIYEAGLDVPAWKDGSIRGEFLVGSFSDEVGEVELEPTLSWHRATIEVEQRLAGYTRHATFDFAVRAGLSVDRFDTHAAGITVDTSPRISPRLAVEVAIWEQEGLGLVTQVSHTFALRQDGTASSVTDLKIQVRIDLTEYTTFEIGYRYVLLRIHDKGDAFDELEHSFSGPMAGLSVAF